MQHKATNFESIYFLEEISFLKVTSLKAVIVLIFLFFASEFYEIFNCVSAKNLLIFFIAYLKKKKATYYLTFLWAKSFQSIVSLLAVHFLNKCSCKQF